MEIIFCDIYKAFIDSCDNIIKENEDLQEHFDFITYFGDIRDIRRKDAAFVSPANCFLSYGGGVDYIYNRDMFPQIQKVLMDKIKDFPTKIKLERSFDKLPKGTVRPILPIGEAIITPLTDYKKYKTCYLVSSPTMVFPTNIEGTDNPYKCFMAALKIIKKHNDENEHQIKTIICPGLGTGIGNVSPQESARQIFMAIRDFVKN